MIEAPAWLADLEALLHQAGASARTLENELGTETARLADGNNSAATVAWASETHAAARRLRTLLNEAGVAAGTVALRIERLGGGRG